MTLLYFLVQSRHVTWPLVKNNLAYAAVAPCELFSLSFDLDF